MDTPQPGHFWKTPFYWTPGSSEPPRAPSLHFTPAEPEWLRQAVSEVMATSADESDQAAVAELGAAGAAIELLDVPTAYFEVREPWWLEARTESGAPVGFVLLALLKPEKNWKEGKTQGTIYYMGVLPGQRGSGYATALLGEAMRRFAGLPCWRVFCDASSRNAPMLRAFRSAGFEERPPWQRPLR